ncbi:MAG: 3-oxoacyl-[acyl-carrier-protein] synthase-3 [Crocinitomicaceae bacterium]|jgi:3-oxoacyl-[acyl-carrier-protein] synthase-3
MAVFTVSNTKIAGISGAIPKNTVSNRDLNGLSGEEIDLLIKTTGIEDRRVASKSLCASDLCITAAEKLINSLNWNKADIEVLIFVTQTPDYILPGTSMVIQDRLGLSTSCMTLDINQGCAGYVYGLSTIASILSASKLKKGLLLVGDTITKLLKEDDNSTVPIFADAGTATALEYDSSAEEMHFNLQTDGSNYDAIIIRDGGARNPIDGNPEMSEVHMKMKGHDIFTFGLREVIPNLEVLLNHAKKQKEEVDYFLFHQANLLLNESIRRKFGIPKEKTPITLNKFGNTSCATIPITLISEIRDKISGKNLQLVLSGFGVGLSWGSAFINISDIECSELIEVDL